MRTVLSHFSEEFVSSFRPLLQPLEKATEGLSGTNEAELQREVLPQLREVQHQLRILVDKVEDQHAFVLIFGPLKSGKSTLMNALSSAYVSEVTALPAYPCMVYVSHADERSFELTSYDGATETFIDTTSLQVRLQRSHGELARAIREAEERGEAFDPALHFTEAIRRIDVRMPAGELEDSGAVLVDTPGLYSRMKFGYDRMTREFRNVAACAIFVVRSDNLFLEQVFEEFTDLLDLFSRIFLVINVDSTKMDLGPEGELVPSVEQTDPLRIVEAFENYAMSAPLKRAADEGRLRIYPIDLLRAASRRLGGSPEDGPSKEASFDGFQGELADFLNSTDYLIAFIQDSLRRAETLVDDLDGIRGRDAYQSLSRRLARLRGERSLAAKMKEVVKTLSEAAWEEAFEEFTERTSRAIHEQAKVTAERTADQMDASIERWFHSSSSFANLIGDDLVPELAAYRDELFGFAKETLTEGSAGLTGGLPLSADLTAKLRESGISIGPLASQALDKVEPKGRSKSIPEPLSVTDVPVRKRFLDWILFRSRASVRQRLFGPKDQPTVRIAPANKASRLGEPAHEAMRAAVDRGRGRVVAAFDKAVRGRYLSDFKTEVQTALAEALAAKRSELEAEIASLDAAILEDADRAERLEALAKAAGEARESLVGLRERHGDGPAEDFETLDPMVSDFEIEPAPPAAADEVSEEEPTASPEIESVD